MYWGKRLILVLVRTAGILALLTGYAYGQQNTGAAPYYDSEHAYRVRIGDVNNPRIWTLYNVTTNHQDTIYNTIKPVTSPEWLSILETGNSTGQAGTGHHGLRIFFDRDYFTSPNWQLRYYEYLEHPGEGTQTGTTYECISARQFDIALSDNTFWLEVGTTETDDYTSQAGMQVYNSRHDSVHTYEEVGTPNTFPTQVNYTVTMHKHDDFDPSYWQFTANFAQAIASFSATVATADGGAPATTIKTEGSRYTVKITPPTGINLSEVRVNLTVQYQHDVLVNVDRSLVVDSGMAVINYPVSSPQPPDLLTDDNITVYPSADPGNRTQAITILAIPSTRNITFDNSTNTNEDQTSAQNPLQNSTHYYKVQMGDINNTGMWNLINSAGDTVRSHSDGISYSQNDPNALATIQFGNLAAGTYTLYFTETNDTTKARTHRIYPVTLQEPLDIDLLAEDDLCPNDLDTDGNILQVRAVTSTTVEYTVRLISGYTQDWSFEFRVLDSLNLDTSLPVTNISITGAATTETMGTYSERAFVGGSMDPNTEITVAVTFTGFYESAQTIDVALFNITGSFNEIDADEGINLSSPVAVEGQINYARHLIRALPQPGELAGVE